MKLKSHQDFAAGLVFVIVGGAFAIGSGNYKLGTAEKMGPGYFPALIGILLLLVGAVVIFQSMGKNKEADTIGRIPWRPLIAIIGANLVFGALLGGINAIGFPVFGMIPAIVALVLMVGLAEKDFKPRQTLALTFLLAFGSWILFVKLLNMQLPLWPEFLVR